MYAIGIYRIPENGVENPVRRFKAGDLADFFFEILDCREIGFQMGQVELSGPNVSKQSVLHTIGLALNTVKDCA